MRKNKTCKDCDQSKPLEDFYPQRKYYSSYCKACDKVRRRGNYWDNQERVKAAQKQWYEDNKEKAKKSARDWYKNNKAQATATRLKYRARKRL
jgi:hypothetical protein